VLARSKIEGESAVMLEDPSSATLADLDHCAAEPIHVPGSIQPHGVLLALHGPRLEIIQVSTSCQALLGHGLGSVLGTELRRT
jgi:light-regulated signal transduction histidine kinase (bacteriophytochrome)